MTPAFAVVPPMSNAMAFSMPERHADRLSADHAGGRSGFQHAHAMRLRLLGLVEPAGRLHDQERAVKPRLLQVIDDAGQISAHARPDIGVGDHRRAALELAILLRQLVRGGDEQVRDNCAPRSALRPRLMVRVAIAMQEQDRDRLDIQLVELRVPAWRPRRRRAGSDLAVGQDSLVDLEAQARARPAARASGRTDCRSPAG